MLESEVKAQKVLNGLIFLTSDDSYTPQFWSKARGLEFKKRIANMCDCSMWNRPPKGTMLVIDAEIQYSEEEFIKHLKHCRNEWRSAFPWVIILIRDKFGTKELEKLSKLCGIVLPQTILAERVDFKSLQKIAGELQISDMRREKTILRAVLHELSQPLTVISGYVTLLKQTLTSKDLERATMVEESVQHLLDKFLAIRKAKDTND